MALNAQRIRYDLLRSLAFGSLTSSYVAVGTPFTHQVRILKIQNLTTGNIIVSFDGINDHDIVPAGTGEVLDYASNRVGPVDQLEQSINTQVWVKLESGATASSGNVYVTTIYAASN